MLIRSKQAKGGAVLTEPRQAGLSETLHALAAVWRRMRKSRCPDYFPVAALSRNPLIVYTPMVYTPLFVPPLGLASWAHHIGLKREGTFLLFPWWSLERPGHAKWLRQCAIVHRIRHPRQRLIFLCNIQAEADLLKGHGETAIVINHNCTVSERIFRPLPGVKVEYQAIYNARLSWWKRHELTLAIERCAFLFYRGSEDMEQAIMERHRRVAPGHRFINKFDEKGVPVQLPPAEVNVELNRAVVGLCLSATEGAMYSSMEYMLAGLPIVSTPNKGGRDVYFDPDYCLIVDPDPRAVRDAVQALAERRIPREVIRSRTLGRIERDRSRFLDLLNEILEYAGGAPAFTMPWPFEQSSLVARLPSDVIAATLTADPPATSKIGTG